MTTEFKSGQPSGEPQAPSPDLLQPAVIPSPNEPPATSAEQPVVSPEHHPRSLRNKIIGGGAAVLALAGIGAGIASASSSSHEATNSGQSSSIEAVPSPDQSSEITEPSATPTAETNHNNTIADVFNTNTPPAGVDVKYVTQGDWNIWVAKTLPDPATSQEATNDFVKSVLNNLAIAASVPIDSEAFAAAVASMGTNHTDSGMNQTWTSSFEKDHEIISTSNLAVSAVNSGVTPQAFFAAKEDVVITTDAVNHTVTLHSPSSGRSGVVEGVDAFNDPWGGDTMNAVRAETNWYIAGIRDESETATFTISYALQEDGTIAVTTITTD